MMEGVDIIRKMKLLRESIQITQQELTELDEFYYSISPTAEQAVLDELDLRYATKFEALVVYQNVLKKLEGELQKETELLKEELQ